MARWRCLRNIEKPNPSYKAATTYKLHLRTNKKASDGLQRLQMPFFNQKLLMPSSLPVFYFPALYLLS